MAVQIDGRLAVVTGGSHGIGLTVAQTLSAAGATVIVADLNPPPPSLVSNGIVYHATDVSAEANVQALMEETKKRGGLDILINNAGIGLEAMIEETTMEDWQRLIAVNVGGVFLCAKHALAAMRMKGGGAIVNIGSIEGMGANLSHAAYAASKGAVHALTRNIAVEYGRDGVRCNAIAPGWIDTPFNDNLIAQYPEPEKARAAIRRLHPLGRTGTADDIAALVLWLVGDTSAFANGQIFVLDGARTARLPLPPL